MTVAVYSDNCLHVVCARCRYQHMHIERLFHMVLLISCVKVRFVQYTVEVAYTGSPFLFFI